MHGKVDLAKSKGLKKSEIRQLNRLLTQRIPADKILTIELADSVAELSNSIGQPVSLVVNRRGQVVNVTVGQPSDVNMPELRGVRVGPADFAGIASFIRTFPKQLLAKSNTVTDRTKKVCSAWLAIG